jgi:hypothetical protein
MSYSSKSWGKSAAVSAAIAIVATIAAIPWTSRIFVPPLCPPVATLSLRCRPGGIPADFYPQTGTRFPCCQDRWHSCAPGGIRTRLCTLILNTRLPLAALGMLCSITLLFILSLFFNNQFFLGMASWRSFWELHTLQAAVYLICGTAPIVFAEVRAAGLPAALTLSAEICETW